MKGWQQKIQEIYEESLLEALASEEDKDEQLDLPYNGCWKLTFWNYIEGRKGILFRKVNKLDEIREWEHQVLSSISICQKKKKSDFRISRQPSS